MPASMADASASRMPCSKTANFTLIGTRWDPDTAWIFPCLHFTSHKDNWLFLVQSESRACLTDYQVGSKNQKRQPSRLAENEKEDFSNGFYPPGVAAMMGRSTRQT
jgi:hypothetical protein